MRALSVESTGDPPRLAVVDVPEPSPGPGEVLVRVAACGFCHHDRAVMAGALRRGVRPGVVLGHEISSVVEEAGTGVVGVRPGDRVASLLTNACGACDRCRNGREHRCRNGEGIGHGRDGGFAEYIALSQYSLIPVPEGLDLVQASLLACPMGVALDAVESIAAAQAGETAVVTGAGAAGWGSMPSKRRRRWAAGCWPLLHLPARRTGCGDMGRRRCWRPEGWTLPSS